MTSNCPVQLVATYYWGVTEPECWGKEFNVSHVHFRPSLQYQQLKLYFSNNSVDKKCIQQDHSKAQLRPTKSSKFPICIQHHFIALKTLDSLLPLLPANCTRWPPAFQLPLRCICLCYLKRCPPLHHWKARWKAIQDDQLAGSAGAAQCSILSSTKDYLLTQSLPIKFSNAVEVFKVNLCHTVTDSLAVSVSDKEFGHLRGTLHSYLNQPSQRTFWPIRGQDQDCKPGVGIELVQ